LFLVRLLTATGLVAAVAGYTGFSASAARTLAAGPASPHAQNLSITIRAGDYIRGPNFALAPGVPVRLTVTNLTHQFHTFTITGLKSRGFDTIRADPRLTDGQKEALLSVYRGITADSEN
jgi:hypothetical protein